MSKNIILNKTKNFNKIAIVLAFPFDYNQNTLAAATMLPCVINYMTKKYPSEEKFSKAKLENFILKLSCDIDHITTSGLCIFTLTIPDPKILQINKLKEQIELLYEFIYHPYVVNQGFDKTMLEREKNILNTNLKNSLQNLRGYINSTLPNLIDKEGLYHELSLYNNIEKLNNINEKDIYKFYKDTIYSTNPYIFVTGNTKNTQIISLLNQKFNSKDKKLRSFKNNFNHFLSPNPEQKITEIKNFKQSAVVLIYKVQNMQNKDKRYLTITKNILTANVTHLLFNELRTKEGLVYHTYASANTSYGILEIFAFIDADKTDRTINKIKEVIHQLTNIKNLQNYLELLKKDYKVFLNEEKDYFNSLVNEKIDTYFKINSKHKTIYKKLLHTRPKNLLKFIKRLHLETIYCIKEEEND